MKVLVSFLICFSFSFNFCLAQSITAKDLLNKSIEYHDPNSQLLNKTIIFDLTETRPNGKDRGTTLVIDVKKEVFKLLQSRDGVYLESILHKGASSYKINGKTDISQEDKTTHKLNDERLVVMRDYYQYLWLMPIKLVDEGTILFEDIETKDFFGKQALEMKVSYDPKVGEDVWYFYFHPETYALIGYRFYHDESKNDGEYIILEGEVQFENIRLPKERKWYMHADDKYLGSDICKRILINRKSRKIK